mmetsp:Transcript_122108/g.350814  ORF Transcript_122108/g.350814 Transcript_122108/m.350814 type:complete len:243 (-) Transcript_122108:106-834(-)
MPPTAGPRRFGRSPHGCAGAQHAPLQQLCPAAHPHARLLRRPQADRPCCIGQRHEALPHPARLRRGSRRVRGCISRPAGNARGATGARGGPLGEHSVLKAGRRPGRPGLRHLARSGAWPGNLDACRGGGASQRLAAWARGAFDAGRPGCQRCGGRCRAVTATGRGGGGGQACGRGAGGCATSAANTGSRAPAVLAQIRSVPQEVRLGGAPAQSPWRAWHVARALYSPLCRGRRHRREPPAGA